MKNQKKMTVILLFVGIAIFGLQGCEKYPDNQLISLRSRAERVANNWVVDNYKMNDVDLTSLVSDYKELFTKEGDYSYQWGLLSGTGTWAFQNDDAEILITGITNQTTKTLVILKLEEKEFWYYIMDGTDKHEYHMIQQ